MGMSKYDRRRRNKKEESSDEESSSSEESWETEDEESETVTESSSEETESESEESEETESESESDSSYVPKRRKSRRLKRRSSDDEEDNISRKEVQKIISRLFPSKYMNERVKERSSRRLRKDKKDKKKKQKEMSDSDEEYEEYMRSIEEDDDDNGGRINIILGIGNGDADDELVEDDNEECDSDDEKTFMKESYQSLELPKEMKQVKELEKKSSKTKKNKTKDSEESDENENKFESEYNDLVDMKKYLTTKLHEKPNSKTLIRSLNETKDAIKKLVKKTRDRNTKNYHKLISSHKQKMTNEMEYFKKKLSHK